MTGGSAPVLGSRRWRRDLISRGRAGAATELRDARDRFVASDPGLARLRHGLRASVAVATTVAVQFLVASALGFTGPEVLLHVMLGSVIAMNMATMIRETRRRDIAVTAMGAPVAAALGAGAATVAGELGRAPLVLFVVVSFLAVWVRRFGPRWFTLGFIAWQAYFFALFLRPPVSALPGLLVAVLVSTTWVTLLLLTVLYDDPAVRLERTVTALRARARAVVSTALEVLEDPGDESRVRALRAQLVKTSEVALLFDGQLADDRALPDGATPGRLRRWLVDLEIGVDELANAAVDLASLHDAPPAVPVDPTTRTEVRRALHSLGWGRLEEARDAVARLSRPPHSDHAPVRRLRNAALLLLDTVDQWASGALLEPATESTDDDNDAADATYDFEPVVTLMGGNLPGSVAVATRAVAGDEDHPRPTDRLRFTTRQAIQAAMAAGLALVAGELISPQRFYWAALAAFICFTGTATTAETVRRGVGRTVGTLLGLVAALALAQLTSGHTTVAFVVLIASIFLAFYLQALSNAAMIFFITLMLGQLYGLLHSFSDELLAIRLAETAAGATAGILVSLFVLPVRAHDALVAARRTLMEHLATLLDTCADLVAHTGPAPDIYTTVLAVDEAARQVANSLHAIQRPRLFAGTQRGRRHRVAVLGVCAATGRSVAQAALRTDTEPLPAVAEALRVLAEEARRLVDVPNLAHQRPAAADRPGLSEQVATLLDSSAAPLVIVRRVQRLADAIALLTPRGRR